MRAVVMTCFFLVIILTACTSQADQQRLEEQQKGVYQPGGMPKTAYKCTVAEDCGKTIRCDDGTTRPAYSCVAGTCGAINYIRDPCLR